MLSVSHRTTNTDTITWTPATRFARASAFAGCIAISLGDEIGVDASAKYFMAGSPIALGPQNRITRLN